MWIFVVTATFSRILSGLWAEFLELFCGFLQLQLLFSQFFLLMGFTFRYIMNAIYDSNIMVYAYLSVMFTMIVRDMNATRFYKNGGSFTIEDQMEVARIFSKEVEHSEENVEAAKEEIIWG